MKVEEPHWGGNPPTGPQQILMIIVLARFLDKLKVLESSREVCPCSTFACSSSVAGLPGREDSVKISDTFSFLQNYRWSPNGTMMRRLLCK